MAIKKNEYEVCRDFANRAFSKVDIVEVIGDHLLLRQEGAVYRSFCPFHEDVNQPSFEVSRANQRFTCKECGEKGDYFDFLIAIQHANNPENSVSYFEIVHLTFDKYLKSKSGLALPGSNTAKQELSMYKAHEEMAKEYHRLLMEADEGKEARDYLASRGIGYEAIKTFQIGFAPSSFNNARDFLKASGYELALMVQAGLLIENDRKQIYDRFRDRIMFPIHDKVGRVIAFGGRAIKEVQPKYLNSPDSLIFQKGETLYGFNQALKHSSKEKPLMLLEGYLDVIAAWQAGYLTACATMGTSLTLSHARMIAENEEVILCYDGDQPGRHATIKAVKCIEEYQVSTSIVELPDNLDPDEFIQLHGSNQFREYMRKREKVEAFMKQRGYTSDWPCPPLSYESFLVELSTGV